MAEPHGLADSPGEGSRKRGLKTGVELSHTVLDAERGKGEFLDCVQRDINGNADGLGARLPSAPTAPKHGSTC